MGSPSVRIAITGDDRSGPVIAAAQARIQALKAASEGAGDGLTHSFEHAKGAAALLGEEVGVKLNRHLRAVLASSELLGPLLLAAFPIAAAIGFIEIAEKIPEVIKSATDALGLFGEAQKKAYADVISNNEHILTQFDNLKQGYKFLQQTNEDISKSGGAKDKSNTGLAIGTGLLGPAAGAFAAYSLYKQYQEAKKGADDLTNAEALRQKQLSQIVTLQNKQNEDNKKAAEAAAKAAEEYAKKVEEAAKSLNRLQVKAFDQALKAQPGAIGNAGDFLGGLGDLTLRRPEGLGGGVDTSNLDARKGWFDSTRTAAEKYDAVLKEINDDFAGAIGGDKDTQARAIKAAASQFDAVTIAAHKFGIATGDALRQAALMGRNWGDVLKSLLVDLVEMIAQMTILDSLSSAAGNKGIGGFFASLASGFFGGKASGGPVAAGGAYLVGESGPELFVPRSSGSIVPNSAMGGTVYNIDARGADISVEQRLRAVIRESENRAVNRSVMANREVSLRR